MVEHKGTGRKDTGRTDEYSNESPKKDYEDFRRDNPGERKDRAKSRSISQGISPRMFLGIPGIQAATQYLKTTAENYNPNDPVKSKIKVDAAVKLYTLISNATPGSVPSTFKDDVEALLAILK